MGAERYAILHSAAGQCAVWIPALPDTNFRIILLMVLRRQSQQVSVGRGNRRSNKLLRILNRRHMLLLHYGHIHDQ